MELWIRSQDKNSLVKVHNIWIDDTDMIDEGYVSIIGNSDFSFELGTYKLKERALEVLDEIQKYLTPTIQMLDETIGNKEVCQIGTIMSIVYNMPKE